MPSKAISSGFYFKCDMDCMALAVVSTSCPDLDFANSICCVELLDQQLSGFSLLLRPICSCCLVLTDYVRVDILVASYAFG